MAEDVVERAGREEAFRADVAAMKVRGGTVARERLLARLGVALLVAGVALGALGYSLSSGTDNALQQRDAIVVALAGVAVSVAGAAVFLRYSLGALLRLWLARQVLDREPGTQRP
jgi:uncharacterized membrane protein YidH (DUF202 family)